MKKKFEQCGSSSFSAWVCRRDLCLSGSMREEAPTSLELNGLPQPPSELGRGPHNRGILVFVLSQLSHGRALLCVKKSGSPPRRRKPGCGRLESRFMVSQPGGSTAGSPPLPGVLGQN